MKPTLPPAVACLLLACLAPARAEAPKPPTPLPLTAGDTLIASIQATPRPNKPYIAQLFAPGAAALPLLDDSPPDHFHHHGLMFAIAVNGTDFWTEKGIPNAGRQVPAAPPAKPPAHALTQSLRWLSAAGTGLLDESRRIEVRTTGSGDNVIHWLDWESSLTPAKDLTEVELGGSHYFGLGMRFLPAWTNRTEWIWANKHDQVTIRGDELLTPGPWCAAHCVVDDRPVTLLMIDHPDNPRPARWFTMRKPFAYLSATPSIYQNPARLAAGKTWQLRYGIAVMRGKPDAATLTQLADAWRARK